MGADYSFYVKTIEIHARSFLTLNILSIGTVESEYVTRFEKNPNILGIKIIFTF